MGLVGDASDVSETTMERPKLRPARRAELDDVLALLRESKLPTEGVVEAFDRFVVADAGGALAGAAGLEVYGDAGLLRSVVVAPDWRGRGLGGELTDAILRRAERDGLREVYLLTETAEGFFPRHGFTRIDRAEAAPAVRASAEFTTLCATTSVAMVRRIG